MKRKFKRTFVDEQKISKHLICPICDDVFSQPSRATCGHTFCKSCILRWIKQQTNCPLCRKRIKGHRMDKDLIPSQLIEELTVQCAFEKCDWRGELGSLSAHAKECKHAPNPDPAAPQENAAADQSEDYSMAPLPGDEMPVQGAASSSGGVFAANSAPIHRAHAHAQANVVQEVNNTHQNVASSEINGIVLQPAQLTSVGVTYLWPVVTHASDVNLAYCSAPIAQVPIIDTVQRVHYYPAAQQIMQPPLPPPPPPPVQAMFMPADFYAESVPQVLPPCAPFVCAVHGGVRPVAPERRNGLMMNAANAQAMGALNYRHDMNMSQMTNLKMTQTNALRVNPQALMHQHAPMRVNEQAIFI